MQSKNLLIFSLCLLFSASLLYSQDGTSLGEIARRARAAKQKAASGAAPVVSSSPKSSAPTNNPPAPTNAVAPSTSVKSTATDVPVDPQLGAIVKVGTVPDDDLNLHYNDHYIASIRQHFEKEEFELLDNMAASARAGKTRLPGGFWAIHNLYIPLVDPPQGTYKATDADFKAHIDRLNRWIAQRPKSITARVALAGTYLNYAANARGGGYADSVTEDGWQLYSERSATAGKILAEAWDLPEKCPEWFLQMLGVVNAQDGSIAMQKAMFEKAVAFEPEYQYYYRLVAEHLLPKWGGEEGDAAAFVSEASDRLGSKKGDMMYFLTASFLNCACDYKAGLHGMSWPRIKSGYAAVEQTYGMSLQNLNKVTMMAVMADDAEYAQTAFARIGDSWDAETWQSRKFFDDNREWASGYSLVKKIEAALKSADSNLTTPEGQKFDGEIGKAFAATYSSAVADCQKKSGDPFLFPFDLLVQVGKTGAVEQVYSTYRTHVTGCLIPQIQTGQFPVPPQPSYWVKIHLQPSPEEIRKLKEEGRVR